MDMMNSFTRRQKAQHEAAQKFALGTVSDVEVTGVFFNDKINSVDIPVVVLKNNTLWRKKNTCDVEVPKDDRKSFLA